ncbi:E3 ubiquitin-protein ligase RNF182-like [Pezoporus occidentalis]|uniref:E3 ubiquitin-protein ligase RNF182-like n=1 Tax=Pezoporus occidentalis TaxID=407982 RepID=UPI002F911B38
MPAAPAPGPPQRGGQQPHTSPWGARCHRAPACLRDGHRPTAASPPGAPAHTAARAAPGPPPGSMAQRDGEPGPRTTALAAAELECKICYSHYDARSRRPKVLGCGHRLCARCLRKMVPPGDASPRQLRCPFCRQHSPVPRGDVQRLRDDGAALALLTGCERDEQRGPPRSPEVLLCPSVLEPAPSPECLVVTILEVPEDVSPPEGLGRLEVVRLYRPASLGALPCRGPGHKCRSWGWRAVPRFILGVLCLLYFSSLPFGIYLLLIEHHSLGIVLVSLVPCTLLLCIIYSLCQCLCREVFGFPHS